MENKYKFPVTSQDIIDTLSIGVDEKYILVLGTSHSAGSCVKGDLKKLPRSGAYPGMLEEETGIKTINLGVPGTDNQQIHQILLDAFSILDPKNCVFVVIESRAGDKTKELFFDQAYPDIDITQNIVYNPEMVNGADISNGVCKTTYNCMSLRISPGKLVSRLTYKKEANESPYIAESVFREILEVDGKLKKPIQKAEVKIAANIIQLIKDDNVNEVISLKNTYHNLVNLRSSIQYIRALNVPVCYFFWDATGIPSHQHFQLEYLKEKGLDQFEVSGIVKSVNKQYSSEYGSQAWDASECECGHRDSVVHAWVTNKILEDMEKYVR